jgi:lysozyme
MLNPPMTVSPAGYALTKDFEKYRAIAYWDDIGKVWTIGWGHTGTDVCEGMVWTRDYADAMLIRDMRKAVETLNRQVDVPLSQGEFDALADWLYNVGPASLEKSTLLALLNAGDHAAACAQLERWDHSHGQVILGLLRRRLADEAEFNSTGLA